MITASFSLPRYIQREKAITVDLTIEENGEAVSISSAAYNLFDENSNLIVASGAATVLSNKVIYNVSAAIVPETLTLSENWLEEWVITLSDGRIETIRREASLVLRLLYPLVSDSDLLKRHSDLNKLLPVGETNWSKPIEAAWDTINAKLISDGKRPYLVLSSWSLKEVHICLTLAYIFTDMMTYSAGGPSKYSDLSTKYNRCFNSAWEKLPLKYDSSETGVPAEAIEVPSSPVLYLKGF